MQLELFPAPLPPAKASIWERLDEQERKAVAATLARLMRQAVHPRPRRDANER